MGRGGGWPRRCWGVKCWMRVRRLGWMRGCGGDRSSQTRSYGSVFLRVELMNVTVSPLRSQRYKPGKAPASLGQTSTVRWLKTPAPEQRKDPEERFPEPPPRDKAECGGLGHHGFSLQVGIARRLGHPIRLMTCAAVAEEFAPNRPLTAGWLLFERWPQASQSCFCNPKDWVVTTHWCPSSGTSSLML